jgi:hypothetical protein
MFVFLFSQLIQAVLNKQCGRQPGGLHPNLNVEQQQSSREVMK